MIKAKTDQEQHALYRSFLDRFGKGGQFDAVAADAIGEFERTVPDAMIPASLCQYWLHYGCGELPELAATGKIFPRPANAPPPFLRLLSPADVKQTIATPAPAFIPAWVRWDGDDELFPELERRPDIELDDAWKYVLPIATDAARPGRRWFCMLRHYNIEVDLPVYHFDADENWIVEVARGFDDLLQAYLRLPPPP